MDYMKISLEDADKWLRENLNEKRYQHSLGTAECAKELAKKYGQNSEKAYIAGLPMIVQNVLVMKSYLKL